MSRIVPSAWDDPDVRDALRDTLEDRGHEVYDAGGGTEPLAWLRSHPPPALIFLDWNIASMNAPQFMDEFLKEGAFASVPVVLITADMHAKQKVRSGPYLGFISKPVDLDALFKFVGSVIGC
ncbi:MAG TPA: response regulator [Myxococcales bacterium]|nr:response regulator [Myxococcales bacterium]